MKLSVVVVGRSRGVFDAATREFETRARRYWKLDIVEVAAGVGGDADEERVRRTEAERLRDRIPDGSEVWALTREGKELSSSGLARVLADRMVTGSPGITFLIGGAHGLDDDLVLGSHHTFSLSRMTLPHALARLVLAEQLYRAGTIARGEPYHKGGS